MPLASRVGRGCCSAVAGQGAAEDVGDDAEAEALVAAERQDGPGGGP